MDRFSTPCQGSGTSVRVSCINNPRPICAIEVNRYYIADVVDGTIDWRIDRDRWVTSISHSLSSTGHHHRHNRCSRKDHPLYRLHHFRSPLSYSGVLLCRLEG